MLKSPGWFTLALKLYNRCVLFGRIAKPYEGGVQDQPELIVQILEAVDSAIQEINRRKQADANFRLSAAMHHMSMENQDYGSGIQQRS